MFPLVNSLLFSAVAISASLLENWLLCGFASGVRTYERDICA